jgi:hypothetical protein
MAANRRRHEYRNPLLIAGRCDPRQYASRRRRARCTSDTEYDLRADAVVACAGGFQANAEMWARYLAGNADFVKVRGSKHDTGEVLNHLLALGAATGASGKAATCR